MRSKILSIIALFATAAVTAPAGGSGNPFSNTQDGQPSQGSQLSQFGQGSFLQATASVQGDQFGQDGQAPQPTASIQGGQFDETFSAPSILTKAAASTTKSSRTKSSRTKSSSSTEAASATAASTTKAASGNKAASVTTTLPASSGSSVLSAVQTISAGESFDGGMVMYDRGVSCTGQKEGGDSDAVFEIEDGGSISNVIIGPNQIEGIHCYGSCTLNNVWWSAVCEDAFTVKQQDASGTTTITGGGAFGAEDKVLQHNGGGTISVSGFYVDNFGKLYRSCGNCDSMYTRHVIIDNVYGVSGSELAGEFLLLLIFILLSNSNSGINSNYNDTATFSSITVSDVDDICVTYEGNDNGDEPTKLSSGADGTNCIYSTSDITEV